MTAKRVPSVLLVAAILILYTLPKPAFGNLFIAVPGSDVIHTQGIIGEYTNSGATINASLISGLTGLSYRGQIAVSGGFIYVANVVDGTIGKYTTSGATVDDSATVPETLSTLCFGLTTAALLGFARKRQRRPRPSVPVVLVGIILISCAVPKVSFGNLFISQTDGNDFTTISEYTKSGAPVSPALIQLRFGGPIAVSDGFIYVTNYHDGTIGKYTTSGATVNAALISGLNDPWDIEISDGFLYVAETGADRVGKYTASGATVNASLISGFPGPYGLAVSGTNLFVSGAAGPVGRYTTSGATVNASLPTGIQYGFESIYDLEVSGSTLFIAHSIDDYSVGKFNLDGTAIDPRLITPPTGAVYFAVSGTDVFITGVSGPGQGTVSDYTTSGDLVADPLISGLGFPFGIAVDNQATVPETLSALWFGLTTVGLLGLEWLLRAREGWRLKRRA